MPLPNVASAILARVLEYCKKHADASVSDEEMNAWEKEFVQVDQGTLFEIILVRRGRRGRAAPARPLTPARVQAANYLNIKGLLELTCKYVASLIKGARPDAAAAAGPARALDAGRPLRRQDARADPQHVQHCERLYGRGRGGGARVRPRGKATGGGRPSASRRAAAGAPREPMGVRVGHKASIKSKSTLF